MYIYIYIYTYTKPYRKGWRDRAAPIDLEHSC